MAEEEKIKQELEGKFGYLKDAVVVKRKGRVFLHVPAEKFEEVFDYASRQMGFTALSAITGLDERDALAVVYHLNKEGSVILSLKVRVDRALPVIKTVTAYFPSADIYERELVDLFGVRVEGLAPGSRYPLPDNWPDKKYPLRKEANNA